MKLLNIIFLSAMMMSAGGAMAETGVFKISGKFEDTSCSVPASQITRGFDIGTIETSKLTAATTGESVLSQPLSFTVTGCPASTSVVRVMLHPANTETADGVEYIRNNGTAQGVLLGMTDSNDNRVYRGEYVSADDLDTVAGTATINTKVHAFRTSAAPAGGSIDSTLYVFLEAF